MLPNNPLAFSLTEHAGKRAGLSEPAGQRRITAEKIGNFPTGKTTQEPVPFLEASALLTAIPGHPTFEVVTRTFQHPSVAAKPGGDQPILGRIDEVHAGMGKLLCHARNLG